MWGPVVVQPGNEGTNAERKWPLIGFHMYGLLIVYDYVLCLFVVFFLMAISEHDYSFYDI